VFKITSYMALIVTPSLIVFVRHYSPEHLCLSC
jgi:hypothetical protein